MHKQGHSQQQQQLQMVEQQRQYFMEAIQDKENLISRLADDLDKEIEKNEGLKRQLERVISERDRLDKKLKSDPLYNIFVGQLYQPSNDTTRAFNTYQQLEDKLALYHNRLQQKQRKISLLQNRLNERNFIVAAQQRQLISLKQHESTLMREAQMARRQHQLRCQQVQRLNKALETAQSRWKSVMDSLAEIREDAHRKMQGDTWITNQLMGKVDKLMKEWIEKSTKLLQSNLPIVTSQVFRGLQSTNKMQTQIMEELYREYDLRNQQISNLRRDLKYFKCQDNRPIQQLSIEHSVREITGISQIWKKKYEQLLQKLKQMVESLQKSSEENEILRKNLTQTKAELEKLLKQKNEINQFKEQIQKLQSQNEKVKKQNQQLLNYELNLLLENQVFHNFMSDVHGQRTYLNKIQQETKKYLERLKKRQHQYKWANLQELINMNRKLMERVKTKTF